jgi:hypothetical protein
MKKYLLMAVLACSVAQPALAANPACAMIKLRDSSTNFVTLLNGFVYLVYPGRDRVAASQWLPLDKLQVCRSNGSASLITNFSKTPPVTITAIRQN